MKPKLVLASAALAFAGLLAVDGDAVFIVEKTPEESLEIVKYRIAE